MSWLAVTIAGAGVGLVFGLFGAGGSAIGTPVLALLGVPAPIAVASPLPAMLPAAVIGARQYFRAGMLDRRVATLAVLAGVPAVLVGALGSRLIDGRWLLILSGLLLLGVGVRMSIPERAGASGRCAARRDHAGIVAALVAASGFVAGLLATGGGFLLVPIFVMALGFTTARAAGTSLVVAAVLTVPTIGAHWVLGDIDWVIAGAFAVGMIPASMLSARVGPRLPDRIARPAFAALLLGFSVFFVIGQLR